MNTRPTVAVIGAGPVGLEAGLYARSLGFPTRIYEAAEIGNHLEQWGQVTLFTPWSLNVTSLGRQRLRDTASWNSSIDPEFHATGHALLKDYLKPLARLPELDGVIQTGTRVDGIGRGRLLKGDMGASRTKERFRLLVTAGNDERVEEADVVLDTTGVFGQPNSLGQGGILAPGERRLASYIEFGVPDVSGKRREEFQGKTVLVVGGGLSAATTIAALADAGNADVIWATRNTAPPIPEIAEDPLPVRLELTRRANRLAAEGEQIRHLPGTVVIALAELGDRVEAFLDGPLGEASRVVDLIIVQTGFRPHLEIFRELQIHSCYASEGPMKLAASLLTEGSSDCMNQKSFGPESLLNPEPGFFILGHKSYGRNPHFLLGIGHKQIRDVFCILTGDKVLNLYEPEASRV